MKINQITILLTVLMVHFPVLANRLESVALKGQDVLLNVGQATSVIGILLGGVLLSLGSQVVGKTILLSGLFGAMTVFGGPALVEVLKGIFT